MKSLQVKDKCLLCNNKLSTPNTFNHYGNCNNCLIKYYYECILCYSNYNHEYLLFFINSTGNVGNFKERIFFNIDTCSSFKEIVDKANKVLLFL